MIQTITMAGLAEAAQGQSLMWVEGSFALIALLVAVAIWKKSWQWALAALLFCGMIAAYLQPWSRLSAQPELLQMDGKEVFDGDEVYWIGQWKGVSYVWFAAASGCLLVMSLFLFRKRQETHSFTIPTHQILSTE